MITTLEVCDMLGMTTASAKYSQVSALLPLITVQIDDYCNGAFSHQVKEEPVTFSDIGSSGYQTLSYQPLIRNTVYVTSTARDTAYYGDCMNTRIAYPRINIPSTYVEDYRLDYESGRIYVPTTDSQISSTGSVLVTYSYIDLQGAGKIAAAKMIEQTVSRPAGVASETVGSMSRSYTGDSMDPSIKTMLAAYRRIGWV
ncbi:MAG TPA: hypothetical protein P5110_10265 [Candidatus Omnitrophota bacterium]|nr:hypothetical protein [Candidatus Omnitrophota bacterium]